MATRRADNLKHLREAVTSVHDQGVGVMRTGVVPHDALGPLILYGLQQGRQPGFQGTLIDLVAGLVKSARPAPPGKPTLCAVCPQPLHPGQFCAAFAIPNRPDATRGVVLGLCEACSPDEATAEANALRGMRKLWPDARPMPAVVTGGGRA